MREEKQEDKKEKPLDPNRFADEDSGITIGRSEAESSKEDKK